MSQCEFQLTLLKWNRQCCQTNLEQKRPVPDQKRQEHEEKYKKNTKRFNSQDNHTPERRNETGESTIIGKCS